MAVFRLQGENSKNNVCFVCSFLNFGVGFFFFFLLSECRWGDCLPPLPLLLQEDEW